MDLRERARRRADPAENAARHAAAVAKGRQATESDNNVVEGSYDPAVVAPIELMTQIYPVDNLERERLERFRREWTSRGAAELLGEDWSERLRVVFARAIFIDAELRTARAPEPPRQWSDRGECEAEAEALKAGRAAWGEAFDRFFI
jgi:hypothetical protein